MFKNVILVVVMIVNLFVASAITDDVMAERIDRDLARIEIMENEIELWDELKALAEDTDAAGAKYGIRVEYIPGKEAGYPAEIEAIKSSLENDKIKLVILFTALLMGAEVVIYIGCFDKK